MRRDNQHIRIGQLQLASRLRTIGQHQRAGLAQLCSHITDRIDDACFRIDMLDCEQCTLTQIRIVAKDLRVRSRSENRIMFDRAHDPSCCLVAVQRNPKRFARPRGENKFTAPFERLLDPLARIFQRSFRRAPFAMRR